MLTISTEEVENRLWVDNPWWRAAAGIGRHFKDLPRRGYFDLFAKRVQAKTVNRAVVLMGPRRVGKTVMVQHMIQELLDTGIEPRSIFYASLDTPLYSGLSLEQLLAMFRKICTRSDRDHVYVFFDEVQYLKNWEVHLKSLVDSYPSHRFIATGSAAAALRLKSQESGAGRFSDFLLPPLTFAEYLRFVKREDELISVREGSLLDQPAYISDNLPELNVEFINYLNFGGYPEAVFSEGVRAESSRYIKSDIIDKVLLRDLPSLYGISDIQELNRLFTVIAYNTGCEINLEGLASSAGIAKNTIKRYLEYLEAAFLIRKIRRIDESAKKFTRERHFKVYLTNPSMRAALFGNVIESSSQMGSLAETAIFSQWLHSPAISEIHYARWAGGEIDIVCLSTTNLRPRWIAEVKWSDRIIDHPEELDAFIGFAKQNIKTLLPTSIVTTKTKEGIQTFGDIKLRFIPTSLYTYVVGRNLVDRGGLTIGSPTTLESE